MPFQFIIVFCCVSLSAVRRFTTLDYRSRAAGLRERCQKLVVFRKKVSTPRSASRKPVSMLLSWIITSLAWSTKSALASKPQNTDERTDVIIRIRVKLWSLFSGYVCNSTHGSEYGYSTNYGRGMMNGQNECKCCTVALFLRLLDQAAMTVDNF